MFHAQVPYPAKRITHISAYLHWPFRSVTCSLHSAVYLRIYSILIDSVSRIFCVQI